MTEVLNGLTADPAVGGDPVTAAAATRVLRRFRLVFNAVKTHFQQVEEQAGIGGAPLWALSVVRAQPGIGVGALARAMDVHQTTASNLVRALVEQGLVESHRSGVDRRATQLKITRNGARVLQRAPGPFAGVLPDALRRLDAATLGRLDADLARLLEQLDTDRRAARIPLGQMWPPGDRALARSRLHESTRVVAVIAPAGVAAVRRARGVASAARDGVAAPVVRRTGRAAGRSAVRSAVRQFGPRRHLIEQSLERVDI